MRTVILTAVVATGLLAAVLAALVPAAHAAAVSGACPPTVVLRKCMPTCLAHSECPDRLLCCPTVCGGTACVRAVTAGQRTPQPQQTHRPGPKPGLCPSVYEAGWLCAARCREDSDCEDDAKCCPTRCGAADCVTPVASPQG